MLCICIAEIKHVSRGEDVFFYPDYVRGKQVGFGPVCDGYFSCERGHRVILPSTTGV